MNRNIDNVHYLNTLFEQKGLFVLCKMLPLESLNMSAKLDIVSEIDEAKILEAIKFTVQKLAFCRVRLHESDDGTLMQFVSDEEPEGIELVDMSSKSEKDIEKYIVKLSRTPFANKGKDTQLYNFKLIRRPDGSHTLFACMFHIIADAYAFMYVITYFDKVYAALIDGTELPPEDNISTIKLIEDSLKYVGSIREQKDKEWWLKQFSVEPQFTTINGQTSHEVIKGKRYGKGQNITQYSVGEHLLRVPCDLVQCINTYASNLNIAPQVFYIFALRSYLAKVCETNDVTIAVTAARRSTLVQKNGGLSIVHLLANRSIIEKNLSFLEGLQYIQLVQNDAYRHSGADYTSISAEVFSRFNVPANHLYKSIVFTYQAYFDLTNKAMDFKASYLNTGLAAYPLYINMMPIDNSGDMWANYLYAKNYIVPKNLDKFHTFMLKFLEMGIANPDMTIRELTDQCI